MDSHEYHKGRYDALKELAEKFTASGLYAMERQDTSDRNSIFMFGADGKQVDIEAKTWNPPNG